MGYALVANDIGDVASLDDAWFEKYRELSIKATGSLGNIIDGWRDGVSEKIESKGDLIHGIYEVEGSLARAIRSRADFDYALLRWIEHLGEDEDESEPVSKENAEENAEKNAEGDAEDDAEDDDEYEYEYVYVYVDEDGNEIETNEEPEIEPGE